jgi:hypothetical protein
MVMILGRTTANHCKNIKRYRSILGSLYKIYLAIHIAKAKQVPFLIPQITTGKIYNTTF